MPVFRRRHILLVLPLFSACTLLPQKYISVPPPSAERLLRIVEERNNGITSLEGRMSSKVRNAKGKSSSTQLILIKKPAYLRLDALTPFGQPALTMATDGEQMALFYHSKRRFFSGPANGRQLSGILPASLSLEEVTLILSGGVPLIDYEPARVFADVTEDHYYRLTLLKEGVREEIIYTHDTLDIVESRLIGPGEKIIMSISMNKYKEVGEKRLPMKIKADLYLENYTMEISYSEISVNGPLEVGAFTLKPPKGVIVEGLDSLNL